MTANWNRYISLAHHQTCNICIRVGCSDNFTVQCVLLLKNYLQCTHSRMQKLRISTENPGNSLFLAEFSVLWEKR
jgi:hypothetical protein